MKFQIGDTIRFRMEAYGSGYYDWYKELCEEDYHAIVEEVNPTRLSVKLSEVPDGKTGNIVGMNIKDAIYVDNFSKGI